MANKQRKTTTRHHHMRTTKSGKVTGVVQHPMKYWGGVHVNKQLIGGKPVYRIQVKGKVALQFDNDKGANPSNVKRLLKKLSSDTVSLLEMGGSADNVNRGFQLTKAEAKHVADWFNKSDSDGDGVANAKDCKPNDPTKHIDPITALAIAGSLASTTSFVKNRVKEIKEAEKKKDITTKQARKLIKNYLDENNLPYSKITARTVHFTDLSRDSKIFVEVKGWKPNPRFSELENIGKKHGFVVN